MAFSGLARQGRWHNNLATESFAFPDSSVSYPSGAWWMVRLID